MRICRVEVILGNWPKKRGPDEKCSLERIYGHLMDSQIKSTEHNDGTEEVVVVV